MGQAKKSQRKHKPKKSNMKKPIYPSFVLYYASKKEENVFLDLLKENLKRPAFIHEWNERVPLIEEKEWLDPLKFGNTTINPRALERFFNDQMLVNQVLRAYIEEKEPTSALAHALKTKGKKNALFNSQLFLKRSSTLFDLPFSWDWQEIDPDDDVLLKEIESLYAAIEPLLSIPTQAEREALEAYQNERIQMKRDLNTEEEGSLKQLIRHIYELAKEHGEEVDDTILDLNEEELIQRLNEQAELMRDDRIPSWMANEFEQ